MSTFPISPNFARNIRIARNSLFVLIPVFILFYILYYLWSPTSSGMVTLGVLFGVVCIIAAVCGIVFYVAFLLAGKCILNLYTTEQDERIKTAGKLMFYGALFPVSWFFVPLLTYKLFAEAS